MDFLNCFSISHLFINLLAFFLAVVSFPLSVIVVLLELPEEWRIVWVSTH